MQDPTDIIVFIVASGPVQSVKVLFVYLKDGNKKLCPSIINYVYSEFQINK